jgi:hypothetical protein
MPLELFHSRAVVLIRQSAFARNRLNREAIDERYNLTDQSRDLEALLDDGPLFHESHSVFDSVDHDV